MNVYDLSRNFWDFAFENPDKIKPNHGAMYFFAIEHCNRLGWKERFGFPTVMAMEAIGIKSYNTFINTLKELVEFGFIEMIEKSKNQYSSNIIALSNFNEARNKALDKALIKHGTKQSESTGQSTVESIDSINKQIYNTTNLPINNNLLDKDLKNENDFDQNGIVDNISSQEEIINPENSVLFPEEDSKNSGQAISFENKPPKKIAQKKGSGKKYFSAADFKKMLIELKVDEKDADVWIDIRRQKRAVFTENVIKLVQDECDLYGLEIKEAIKYCAKYGWQGFEYEWYLNKKNKENGKSVNNTSNFGSSKGTASVSNTASGKTSATTAIARHLAKLSSGNSESGDLTIDAEIL